MSSLSVPYRQLFESNPHPMWVFDLESLRFLAVNDAAVQHYGWTRDEFLAMTLRDIRPEADHAALERAVRGTPPGIERSGNWRHVTKDGRLLHVEIASHDVDFDGRRARLAVAYDTTDQHRAAAAVRESEERFRLLARATTDAVWDWDLASDAIWWSEGFEALFGARPEEAAPDGAAWVARIHPDDRERVAQGIQAVIRGSGDSWRDEYRLRRGDGTYAIVTDRGFVIRRPDGSPLRMVGGMSDVTEHRALEQQVLRAQRLESIGTLAGGIAHDLNNMLSPILMSIDLVRDHVTSDEGRDLLSAIETSAQRGADLVRQVLTYARGVDGQRAPVAVRDLVRDLARIVLDTFPRDLQFRTDLPDDLWPVIGDRTQMQQVLLNLCVNARDAMPEGGTLLLQAENVRVDERDASQVADARPGTFVRLSVSDTGPGIPPRLLDRIFEPFFTTKAVGKGTGLGLSTVQAIVRSHGGFVDVRSVPEAGSTFSVHFPADPEVVLPDGPMRRATPARGLRELVLLVEDEPSIRGFAAASLERSGYRVQTAGSVAEAAALLGARASDCALVVTDLMMPDGGGAAVVRAARAAVPTMPVIVMSGHPPSAGHGALAHEPGILHLLKPFTGAQLEDAVRRALAQRSPR